MGVLTKPTAVPSQDILHYCFPANVIPKWTVDSTSGDNETINVPEYSNSVLATAYADYLAAIPVKEAEEAAAEEAEAQAVVNLIQNSNAPGSLSPSLITKGGRQYLRRDRWYTGADDQYGFSYYQFAEQAGSGNTPIIEWEHLGVYVPAGRKLGNITFVGRTNNSSVYDIDMYLIAKKPSPTSRWETGFDNDSEVDYDVLYDDTFMYPSVGDQFSGASNDMHRRTINLGYEVTEDILFGIYMRPDTDNSSTRYFYHTWTLEVY